MIRSNIPDNIWVKKAVNATKQGLPLLIIEGGGTNKVFMTAGVHGNELPPQVAAMRVIKYLVEHPIEGTVYFMPFVNAKAINNHVRLTDYDYNRVAHRRNTVSNNIVNFIIKNKCSSYGDFHSTVMYGDPGDNIILGYRSPAGKCVDLTNFLARNCHVHKKFYSYAGQVYRWSLADMVNYYGIPAVICEVISPVNRITSQNVALSTQMMNQFLKFNHIL